MIISIASHIDLNTLDALSRTCRQVRANLLQFRTQLLQSTLHCENEKVELDPDNTFRYRARAADWYFVDIGRATAVDTGKVGDCARDMVNGCRRCGRVVCRVSLCPVLRPNYVLTDGRIVRSNLPHRYYYSIDIDVSVKHVLRLRLPHSSVHRSSPNNL